jgi:hypothetical protein
MTPAGSVPKTSTRTAPRSISRCIANAGGAGACYGCQHGNESHHGSSPTVSSSKCVREASVGQIHQVASAFFARVTASAIRWSLPSLWYTCHGSSHARIPCRCSGSGAWRLRGLELRPNVSDRHLNLHIAFYRCLPPRFSQHGCMNFYPNNCNPTTPPATARQVALSARTTRLNVAMPWLALAWGSHHPREPTLWLRP